ncbi:MAG: hypothetical protein LBC27_06775 [Spirochaetaceae bacterium]|nr:hypothetical protein [Spirochaetaceae bacterium]
MILTAYHQCFLILEVFSPSQARLREHSSGDFSAGRQNSSTNCFVLQSLTLLKTQPLVETGMFFISEIEIAVYNKRCSLQ